MLPRSALSLPSKRVATQSIGVQVSQYSDGINLLLIRLSLCIMMSQPGPLSKRLQRHRPPQDRSKRYSGRSPSGEELGRATGTKNKPWSFRQHNAPFSGVVALNLRLGQAVDMGRSVSLVEILKEMKNRGLRPDILTYNSAMELLGKHSLEEEAWALVDDMKAIGVMPDIETYKFLLEVR